MDPFAFIAVVVILLVAAFLGIRAIIKNRRKKARIKSQSETLQWVTAVENATTDDEIQGQGYFSPYFSDTRYPLDDQERQAAATAKYVAACRRIKSRKVQIELGDHPEPYDVAMACLQVCADNLDSELALRIEDSELGALFVDAMKVTLAMFRQGDLVAMAGYAKAMDDVRAIQILYAKYDVPALIYPPDWDDMVIKMIKSPSVDDFKNTPEQSVGDVRLMSAEALRVRDRKLAKLVLAYCLVERIEKGKPVYSGYGTYVGGGESHQVIWPFRDAIGGVLRAELIKLVEELEFISETLGSRSREL